MASPVIDERIVIVGSLIWTLSVFWIPKRACHRQSRICQDIYDRAGSLYDTQLPVDPIGDIFHNMQY